MIRRIRLDWPRRGVAQPGSALPLGGRGPRFESGRPDVVLEMAEDHDTLMVEVAHIASDDDDREEMRIVREQFAELAPA